MQSPGLHPGPSRLSGRLGCGNTALQWQGCGIAPCALAQAAGTAELGKTWCSVRGRSQRFPDFAAEGSPVCYTISPCPCGSRRGEQQVFEQGFLGRAPRAFQPLVTVTGWLPEGRMYCAPFTVSAVETLPAWPPRRGPSCLGLWSLQVCNQEPQTGGLVNSSHLFPTVLQAGSPRSGRWHGQVLVGALFRGARLLLVSSRVEEQREEASFLLTHRGTHATMGTPPSGLHQILITSSCHPTEGGGEGWLQRATFGGEGTQTLRP